MKRLKTIFKQNRFNVNILIYKLMFYMSNLVFLYINKKISEKTTKIWHLNSFFEKNKDIAKIWKSFWYSAQKNEIMFSHSSVFTIKPYHNITKVKIIFLKVYIRFKAKRLKRFNKN